MIWPLSTCLGETLSQNMGAMAFMEVFLAHGFQIPDKDLGINGDRSIEALVLKDLA